MTQIVDVFARKVRCLDPIFIPMRDGVLLAATIWLPQDAEANPTPAILELIPYRRRDGTVFRDVKMHPYTAGHGFACCRVDIRGSGDSGGILTDEYTDQEFEDAEDIIAWLAAQPWCTGTVGMTGISWGGFNALQLAARQPPALKAVIALCCSDDRYADDVHYAGGCLLTEDAMWSSFIMAIGALPPDPQIVGDKWRDMWMKRLEATSCWSDVWLAHQRRDAYWKRGSVCEDFSRIKIPVYAISGWDDTYFNAVPRLVQNLAGAKKGLIGPWSHAYPFTGEPGPAIGYLQEAIRWWRHWLKGEDTGIMAEPAYTAWVLDPHLPAPAHADYPGRWVSEPSWPSPNIRDQVFHVNGGSLAQTPGEGDLLLCAPVAAVQGFGRFGGYGGGAPDLALDQRRDDALGAYFDTEPLLEDLEILGSPTIEFSGVCSSENALVAAKLCDVAPDGTSTRVSWGCLNLTHRESHETPEKLDPSRRFSCRVSLNHLGRRIPRGNRLRLTLTTQLWPVLWPSPHLPAIHMEVASMRVHVPVRVSRDDGGAPSFALPEISQPLDAITLIPEEYRREIAVDVGAGSEAVTLTSDFGRIALADRGIVTASRAVDRMEIVAGDPLSARLDTSWSMAFEGGGAEVEAQSRVLLTSDAHRFQLEWWLDVFEKGERVFTKTGQRDFERDHL